MSIDYADHLPQIVELLNVDFEQAFYVFEEIQDRGLFKGCNTDGEYKNTILNYCADYSA